MDRGRVDEFRRMLADHPSEELLVIWQANDRAEWPDEAFEAIRRLLQERGVALPEQRHPRSRTPDTRPRRWLRWGAVALAAVAAGASWWRRGRR